MPHEVLGRIKYITLKEKSTKGLIFGDRHNTDIANFVPQECYLKKKKKMIPNPMIPNTIIIYKLTTIQLLLLMQRQSTMKTRLMSLTNIKLISLMPTILMPVTVAMPTILMPEIMVQKVQEWIQKMLQIKSHHLNLIVKLIQMIVTTIIQKCKRDMDV